MSYMVILIQFTYLVLFIDSKFTQNSSRLACNNRICRMRISKSIDLHVLVGLQPNTNPFAPLTFYCYRDYLNNDKLLLDRRSFYFAARNRIYIYMSTYIGQQKIGWFKCSKTTIINLYMIIGGCDNSHDFVTTNLHNLFHLFYFLVTGSGNLQSLHKVQ